MILASSDYSHPREFACLLRADDDVITELILVPGTISGQRSAILRLHMMPIDFSVMGTAHSHPTPNAIPSEADLKLFSQRGLVHIIAGYPYDMNSWKAYDRHGRELELKVY